MDKVSGVSLTSGGLATPRHQTGAFFTAPGQAMVLKQPRDSTLPPLPP